MEGKKAIRDHQLIRNKSQLHSKLRKMEESTDIYIYSFMHSIC